MIASLLSARELQSSPSPRVDTIGSRRRGPITSQYGGRNAEVEELGIRQIEKVYAGGLFVYEFDVVTATSCSILSSDCPVSIKNRLTWCAQIPRRCDFPPRRSPWLITAD